jgi:hypothetical protein
MKTVIKILVLGAVTLLLAFAATAKDNTRVKHDKDRNVFVLKTDKDLVGGKVEILQQNGMVIAEQTLRKRKLVIDFNESKSGYYMIRIVKGKNIKEYYYQKV